jgi:hypothetical protein
LNRDFVEMLSALSAEKAEFLVVGAHAMAAHGYPRATGDLDIWVHPTPGNAKRVWRALAAFGAPLGELSEAELASPGIVFQIGLAPCRIDLLTGIDGVEFPAAWPRRTAVQIGGTSVPVIGREDLIANKRASGRAKDLIDLARLESRPRD